MNKYRFFSSFDKEEAWLSGMARQGWLLTSVGALGGYGFQQGEPGTHIYRIDYRTFKSRTDYADYLQLFADSGWYHIAGSRHSGAQYFLQTRADGDSDIFSDDASKAGRYRRHSQTWLSLVLFYFIFFISAVLNGGIDPYTILHPQALYYTPGLWEMTGLQFWRAFLFETPFALGRGFAWLIYLVFLIILLYFAVRSALAGHRLQYKSDNNK